MDKGIGKTFLKTPMESIFWDSIHFRYNGRDRKFPESLLKKRMIYLRSSLE